MRHLSGDGRDAVAMGAVRRRWSTGVAVVITAEGGGYRGATIGAMAMVSVDPPLVLACVDREGRLAGLLTDGGAFAVSILERHHEPTADRFAGRGPLPDAALTGIPHQLSPSGLPVLAGALAWLDCRVRDIHDGGDHTLIIGSVEATGLGVDTDDPLITYGGRYRGIEAS
jgi:flavin reductase (DIM6/NTAB) family NADH-FMN oxidoreductase RutF